MVLLDIVSNTVEKFERKSYDDLCKIAREFGFEAKKKAAVFDTFEEFSQWINEVSPYEYKFNNEYIEGFVIEDMDDNMCKFKTSYYRLWKYLRRKIGMIKSRNLKFDDVKSTDNTPESILINEFLTWYYENNMEMNTDTIIELREMFERK